MFLLCPPYFFLSASFSFFFFNDTATTEIYPLSLHDALPISRSRCSDRTQQRVPRSTRRLEFPRLDEQPHSHNGVARTLRRASLEPLCGGNFPQCTAELPNRGRDPTTHLEGVGERAVRYGVFRKCLRPRARDVHQDLTVPRERERVGRGPPAPLSHDRGGERMKRYGVGLHFRKREARDRVEATLAPPELLRQEQVREPLSGDRKSVV